MSIRATPGYNLATEQPEIAKQWHGKKNGKLTPADVTPNSSRKAWWQCSDYEDHEWCAAISARTKTPPSGCPFCNGRLADSRTSLAAKFPEIADEWLHAVDMEKYGDYRPQNTRPRSNIEVYWQCPEDKEHKWICRVSERTGRSHRSCEICQSLAANSPTLLAEWNFERNKVSPWDVKPQAHTQVYWICPSGHPTYLARIQSRFLRGDGCPVCSGRTVIEETSIAITHPLLVTEMDPDLNEGIDPRKLSPGSHKEISWRCKKCAHAWTTPLYSRTNRKLPSGCPRCVNQTSRLEIRAFCELHSLFNDAHWRYRIDGLECDVYIESERIAIEIDGAYFHEGKQSSDRQKNERLADLGITLIRIRESPLGKISDCDVLTRTSADHMHVMSDLCRQLASQVQGVEMKNHLLNYARKGLPIADAEYRKVIANLPAPPEGKSFADKFPNIATQWDYERNYPLTPEMFTSGANKTAYWICGRNRDHPSYPALIKSRTRLKKPTGCPVCSGNVVTDFNSLRTTHPNLAEQWIQAIGSDATPDKVTKFSATEVLWKCRCGREVKARVCNRAESGRCRKCSRE